MTAGASTLQEITLGEWMKIIILLFLVLVTSTVSCSDNKKSAEWSVAEDKWQQFAQEHMERMKQHESGFGYKFDMKWTPIKSHLLAVYFPQYKFFGDQRFSFALSKDGRIICFYISNPLNKPFKSAPDLEAKVFEDFLKEKGIRITDPKIAEDIAKMAEIIKNAGKRKSSDIESSTKFRVEKKEGGWIIDTPNAGLGNSVYLNADYEILVNNVGEIQRIQFGYGSWPIDALGFTGELYAPSLNRGNETIEK